jgi:glutamine synthetase
MQISFDPICQEGHIGSGFHVHMSPRHGNGPNDFILIREEKIGALAPEAVRLIAGLSRVGGALMAFGNRTETSFIRLNQGKEAPSTVCWGDRNRRALIRLPLVAKNEAGELVAPPTVEFRLGDGSAHPHFLMAGLAMAMLHGVAMTSGDALDLVAATEAKPHSNDTNNKVQRKVPQTRDEVAAELGNFRESFEHGNVFPKVMIDAILAKR